MALSETDLSEIEKVLSASEKGAPVYAQLRQQFPKLAWTQCDASDVTEPPFRTFPAFELHLLDASDHCAHVTDDLAKATGLILAKRI